MASSLLISINCSSPIPPVIGDRNLTIIFNTTISLPNNWSDSSIYLKSNPLVSPMNTDLIQILSASNRSPLYAIFQVDLWKDKHLFFPCAFFFLPLGGGTVIQWVRFQARAWLHLLMRRISVDQWLHPSVRLFLLLSPFMEQKWQSGPRLLPHVEDWVIQLFQSTNIKSVCPFLRLAAR